MIRINLLPRELVRGRAIAPRTVLVAAAVVVLAALSAATVYLNSRNTAVRTQLEATNREIETLRPQVARVEGLRRQIETARRKEQLLRALERVRIPWDVVLDEVRQVMPKDIWLTGVSAADDGSILFNGYGLSYEAVARFMVSLGTSRKFEGVDLTVSQKQLIGSREVVNFSITAKLTPARKVASGQ